MPFSELKIDTSFVRDVFAHEDARTMVETMVLAAHKLRLTACAEGVESQEGLDFLDGVGCDRAQGYFIGRPMAGTALELAVRERNSKRSRSGDWLACGARQPPRPKIARRNRRLFRRVLKKSITVKLLPR